MHLRSTFGEAAYLRAMVIRSKIRKSYSDWAKSSASSTLVTEENPDLEVDDINDLIED